MSREMERAKKVRAILDEARAVITDTHVVYTSGMHGNAYVNKDAVYPKTANIEMLCREIVEEFWEDDIEFVVGPVHGATVLAFETAKQLSAIYDWSIPWAYAEKDGVDGFVIKRGNDKRLAGKRVLIVEDVLTTGRSVRRVVELVRSLGGEVVGVAALVNRGGVTSDMIGSPLKFISLLNVQMDAWDEKDCKLCADQVPVNIEVGKGREFLARKAEAQHVQ